MTEYGLYMNSLTGFSSCGLRSSRWDSSGRSVVRGSFPACGRAANHREHPLLRITLQRLGFMYADVLAVNLKLWVVCSMSVT